MTVEGDLAAVLPDDRHRIIPKLNLNSKVISDLTLAANVNLSDQKSETIDNAVQPQNDMFYIIKTNKFTINLP